MGGVRIWFLRCEKGSKRNFWRIVQKEHRLRRGSNLYKKEKNLDILEMKEDYSGCKYSKDGLDSQKGEEETHERIY